MTAAFASAGNAAPVSRLCDHCRLWTCACDGPPSLPSIQPIRYRPSDGTVCHICGCPRPTTSTGGGCAC